MAERKTPSDKNILELAWINFGSKETVKHYLTKAYKASKTAKTDLSANNIPHFVHNSTVVIEAVEQLWILLGDSRVDLPNKKE